jgi:hypothetical protein
MFKNKLILFFLLSISSFAKANELLDSNLLGNKDLKIDQKLELENNKEINKNTHTKFYYTSIDSLYYIPEFINFGYKSHKRHGYDLGIGACFFTLDPFILKFNANYLYYLKDDLKKSLYVGTGINDVLFVTKKDFWNLNLLSLQFLLGYEFDMKSKNPKFIELKFIPLHMTNVKYIINHGKFFFPAASIGIGVGF